MASRYACGNEGRRKAVRDTSPPPVNGIDYLEVGADQRTLTVTFLHDLPGAGATAVPPPPAPALTRDQVEILGGVRIRNVHVLSAVSAGSVLTVGVDAPGDFSTYTLRLRRSPTDEQPPPGFDPRLSEVAFSFKVDCASDFDCKVEPHCLPETPPEPEIDYLAKDYASFRSLMLDRMTALAPDWSERNAADGHVALVELLAYVGDHLSYFQDSVATEAYLGTARKRVSLRRHARLLNYDVHSGCNARAFVVFDVEAGSGADGLPLPAGRQLLTRTSADDAPTLRTADLGRALAAGPTAFQTTHPLVLHAAHDAIPFYTWSDAECCLPKGATSATLLDAPPLTLVAGDLVLFEEVVSPTTGAEADADRTHRHVVRLTSAVHTVDPLDGTRVLEIEWAGEDALPFPLCISALAPGPGATTVLAETSVARGNVALADHGLWLDVGAPVPATVPDVGLYRPRLTQGPVTFRCPVDARAPAATASRCDPRQALPQVELAGEGTSWSARFDLLKSDRFEPSFVVEVESDGVAHLRFGDDERGRRPRPGSDFTVRHRVGNGRAGNVAAEAISRVVLDAAGVRSVRNPLPAFGGTDPEPLDQVRAYAPEAFRVQERAVTEGDYGEVAERHGEIQRAAGRFRWTGSWYTVFVTVDRLGGRPVDVPFRGELKAFLDRYRMAGHDLEVAEPKTVPLDLALEVCVKPGYFRSDVEERLLEQLGSGVLPGGGRGFFHPDNFTFGQRVYLSRIYETAMDVAGVSWVRATRLQRFGHAAAGELGQELLAPAPTEVPRLDNDPNFPENGRLELVMKGGL